MEYNSFSPQDTFDIAKKIGEQAKAGEVYCLNGDLGVGKTLFSQGFAKGLRVEDSVNSPTFTIVQEYNDGRLPLYHFDVYRIEEPEEMEEVGFSDMVYGDGVCLIEWANLIQDILPKQHTVITIEKNLEKGFDYRLVRVEQIGC